MILVQRQLQVARVLDSMYEQFNETFHVGEQMGWQIFQRIHRQIQNVQVLQASERVLVKGGQIVWRQVAAREKNRNSTE